MPTEQWATIKVRRSTLLAVMNHLASHPLKPEQQSFISDLIELGMKMKRIPLMNSTKGVTR